jgi:hypothetical protein
MAMEFGGSICDLTAHSIGLLLILESQILDSTAKRRDKELSLLYSAIAKASFTLSFGDKSTTAPNVDDSDSRISEIRILYNSCVAFLHSVTISYGCH